MPSWERHASRLGFRPMYAARRSTVRRRGWRQGAANLLYCRHAGADDLHSIFPGGLLHLVDQHSFGAVSDQVLQAIVAVFLDRRGALAGMGPNLLDAILGQGDGLFHITVGEEFFDFSNAVRRDLLILAGAAGRQFVNRPDAVLGDAHIDSVPDGAHGASPGLQDVIRGPLTEMIQGLNDLHGGVVFQ